MNMAEPTAQTVEHPPHYWSLNKASKELGINKSTLSTDASRGKIQWHSQPDGTRKLFAPELYTFYAERLKTRTERAERVLNVVTRPELERGEQSNNTDINGALNAKDELVEVLKSQISDLRHDRDQWRQQAEDATRQLTDALIYIKALPAPATVSEPAPKRKWFFGLF
jgi:hypothetical protein